MKTRFFPAALLCMILTAVAASGEPGDTFYEANLSLTRAARLEKEGDYKAALESGKKAAELLQSMQKNTPEWNPSWVEGKLDAATQLKQRVESLARKAGERKKEDYSLKPGEWRDVTFERAYKAHEQQKLVAVPVEAPAAPGTDGTLRKAVKAAPSSSGQPVKVRMVSPVAVPMPRPASRYVPSRSLPPRTERDGRFRIGS